MQVKKTATVVIDNAEIKKLISKVGKDTKISSASFQVPPNEPNKPQKTWDDCYVMMQVETVETV